MTTIAADARLGIMVSDSKCSWGNQWFPSKKVYRVNDFLIGLAGEAAKIDDFVDYLRAGSPGKPPKGDFSGLLLRASGLYAVSSDGSLTAIDRGFHAIGSGDAAALGAMLAGAPPQRAVEIALDVDTYSGGAIQTFHLDESAGEHPPA